MDGVSLKYPWNIHVQMSGSGWRYKWKNPKEFAALLEVVIGTEMIAVNAKGEMKWYVEYFKQFLAYSLH